MSRNHHRSSRSHRRSSSSSHRHYERSRRRQHHHHRYHRHYERKVISLLETIRSDIEKMYNYKQQIQQTRELSEKHKQLLNKQIDDINKKSSETENTVKKISSFIYANH